MGRQVILYVRARFGRGTVQEILPYRKGSKKVRMLCDCGKEYITYSPALYAGECRSCGCLQRERVLKHGHTVGEHSVLYSRWKLMTARCHNPKNKSYKNYGGRGIQVCDRWRADFLNFLEDMGTPAPGLELDRIDNNGNYCKENCRWVSRTQQARNTRKNHRFTLGDRLLLLSEAAEEFGILLNTLSTRIYAQGLSLEEALTKPVRPIRRKK